MKNGNRSGTGITRRTALKSGVAAGTIALAGCAAGGGDGDGGFVGALAANTSTFDPAASTDAASSQCIDLMYEPLVGYDFDLNLQPVLASDWEQVDDTTFRFLLREGVQFHTGDEMTAEDVQHSLERYEGTANESVVYQWYDSSEVAGDYEIVLNLSEPYAPIMADLWGVSIVPAGTQSPAEGDSPLQNESRGTGPFQFESWSQDDRFVATRFEDYWWGDAGGGGDLPDTAPIEELNLRVIVEQSAQLSALRTGDVDMINAVPPQDVPSIEDNGGLTLTQTGGITFDFLIYPVNSGPFQNVDFRRGITRLIPRDAIVGDAVFNGTATKGASPYPPQLGAPYWDEQFEQSLLDEYVGEDPDAASQLLDNAFSELGIDPPFQMNVVTNENPVRQRWCEVIQASLDETDYFDVDVQVMEWSSFVDYLFGQAYQSNNIVALGWTASADPDSFVYQILASDQHTPDGYNINHYTNEQLDQLMEQGQRTFGDQERGEIYRQIAELLAQEVPVTFLWHGNEMDAVRSETVGNWRSHPSASANYSAIYKPYFGQSMEYEG